jgi:hypothetical protein
MSSLIDMLTSSLDDNAVATIGRQLGKDPAAAKTAINSALPMLLGALQKSTQQDSGAGLAQALASKHDGGVLDNVAGFLSQDDGKDGAGILRHILGAKQGVAESALGALAGVDKGQASGLLATLAPLVLGAVGKAKTAGNTSGSDLTQMLNRETQGIEERSPGVMKALGGMLDADGDGDTDLADLLKLGSGKLGGLFR